ncbi:hypothetical protein [Streptomyces sp. NPDC003032]
MFSSGSRVRGPAVFYAEQRGADHYGIPGLHGPVTAWFRFHLMRDEQARGLYFGPDCTCYSSPFWSAFECDPPWGALP